MRKIFEMFLVLVFICSTAFAGSKNSKESPVSPKMDTSSPSNLKDILYQLIKQDEYMDETIEKIKGSNKLNRADSDSIIREIRIIRKGLNEVSALNKSQLSNISADSETAKYTRMMMIYSNKINRKINIMRSLLVENSTSSKSLRNAPLSSGKVKGKKLQQILKEKEISENIKREFISLEKSAARLKASSKWLYIASK